MGKTKTKSGKTNFRNTEAAKTAEDEFFAMAEETKKPSRED